MTRRKMLVDGRGIKVNAVTPGGGAVVLNANDGVHISYAMPAADGTYPEILHCGIKLKDGRGVGIMIDRQTGKFSYEVIGKNGDGREVHEETL